MHRRIWFAPNSGADRISASTHIGDAAQVSLSQVLGNQRHYPACGSSEWLKRSLAGRLRWSSRRTG